jgi:hypothetical protein
MAGFSTVRSFALAEDNGKSWLTQFRKTVASAATTTSGWIDYTYAPGSPSANFYASTPYESAYVEAARGFYVPDVAPDFQFLRNLKVMTNAASATSTTNARQHLILADYLMYYPFIDTDAVGEEQLMDNTLPLPRYSGGKVVAVAQSAGSTAGQFTFTYTNQDGVAGRVSQNNYTFIVAGGGMVVGAFGTGASYSPFLHLQVGDTGVRSIESVTFTAAGGGLMALVIVHPLFTANVTQECRRTTTGNLESYGACDEFAAMIHRAGAPRLIDGRVLGFFAAGYAGSLATSALVGTIETVWG